MDNTYERKNRIEQALNIRNMKQVELVEKTGLSKGSINHWIKQRYQPKQNAIMKMAKALEVSEMWLAGYDVPMERPAAQIKNDELVQLIYEIKENEDLKDLFSDICKLTNVQRNAIKSIVSSYKDINSVQ